LDMASGPIQYEEYLEYSKNFATRYCVDLSSDALAKAELKIGTHGKFLLGSFFDLEIEENYFDCAVSLHTIYHMSADKQEEAITKLLKIVKPGKPVIIVYSNPDTLIGIVKVAYRRILKGLSKLGLTTEQEVDVSSKDLYFHSHSIEWWARFNKLADVQIYPWRAFDVKHQKMLFPNNAFGRSMLSVLFYLEETFPIFFYRNFQYPMIVLTKNNDET